MPERLGRYEIVRELGKGAMGVVYEGKDPNIGRRVAIKTARRDVMQATGMGDEMMKRFLREAQAAGALNHPNIITIYDAAEENDIAYIAMEYLEGGDLADLIEGKRRLGVDEIIEIGAAVCDALDVAHRAGVVHRDIKPANIMMPTNGPTKVADFGIARVQDSNLTQEGALIGTPHYMSPEQFMGQRVDGRSDLFSVGNILYELITGEKPFSGEQLSTVMHHVIKTDPVKPSELNFSISKPLDGVVMKALSKRPDDRFQTAGAMAAALRECLKPHPDPAILTGQTAGASQDATMVGGGVDATVVGSPPPDVGDATVAGPPPEGVIEGPATVVGAPPPTEEDVGTTKEGDVPAPTKKLALPLIGGVAAVVVLLVAVVAVLLRPDHWYSSIAFEVWRAPSDETFVSWSPEDLLDAQEVESCRVRVSDADSGEVLADIPSYEQADVITWPDKKPRRLRYEIIIDGKTEHSGSPALPAAEADETHESQIVMLPPKDDQQ